VAILKKVDHIGIAVRNLDETIPYYTETLGLKVLKIEEVASESVRVAFIDAGNVKLELLEPMSEQSAIHTFIEKKGEGIHHIALAVDDIKAEMKRLQNEGFEFIYPEPKYGADNQYINFIHPKYTNGVLIELCQDLNKYPLNQ
jgi:methylmalonyl-CoA/ethylmalonyl-CoA epimerase